MRETETAKAIETLISGLWTSPPKLYFQGQPRDDGVTEFVAVEILAAMGEQLFVGNPTYRYGGMVNGRVHVPSMTGTRKARSIADTFANIFYSASKLPLSFNDPQAGAIRFFPPQIGGINDRDKDWLRVDVLVTYLRDVVLS